MLEKINDNPVTLRLFSSNNERKKSNRKKKNK